MSSFKPTLQPDRQFRPMFARQEPQPTIAEFATEAREAVRRAVEVSQGTFRADVDGLRPSGGLNGAPDELRMAAEYRARAGDLLEAALELFEAAEAAAVHQDLAQANALRVKALRRSRSVFPV